MSWKSLIKQFKLLLFPSIAKRIDFHVTTYRKYYSGEAGRAWITWDGEEITNMAYTWIHWGDAEEKVKHSVFSQDELPQAIKRYLNNSIDEVLVHENPLIRALGILDRRVGKRRLKKLNFPEMPPLEKQFFIFRHLAEGESLPANIAAEIDPLKDTLKNKHLNRKRRRPEEVKQRTELRKTADATLKQSGRDNLRNIVSDSEQIQRSALRTEAGRSLHDAMLQSTNPTKLAALILHVDRVGNILKDSKYVEALIEIADYHHHWIREPETWKPKTKNKIRQFSSLVRHMLVKFEMPQFMDSVWTSNFSHSKDWYCWIASGNNIRKADNLPIHMTRAIAHHFTTAPDNYPVGAAFRWGQIRSIGGDEVLCDAISETRLTRDFVDDGFCKSVFQFFVENPMLDRSHVGPIVDFIWNRKFEPVVEHNANGELTYLEPAQPNFSIKGRTVTTILRDVQQWHESLGQKKPNEIFSWRKTSHGTFFHEDVKQGQRRTWTIRELGSTLELIAEGKRMEHCVATYDRSCCDWKCSIWTMELTTERKTEALLTIELCSDNSIRQARGFRNRIANEAETSVMNQWASTLNPR